MRTTSTGYLALWVGLAAAGCGTTSGTDAGGGGGAGGDAGAGDGGGGAPTITIQSFTFSPSNLVVVPGATVTVRNLDAFDHSVTSQAAQGQYTPGEVNGVSFDTGPFTGTRTFTIPSSAPSGTVVPYFCSVHTSGMANTGQITIQ